MRYFCLTIFALLSLASSAQFTFTNGPKVSGLVGYVWANTDTAFATKDKDLYQTKNGGTTWDRVYGTLPNDVDVRAIAEANGIVFIGTNSGSRIYSSANWGNTWKVDKNGSSPIWVPTHLTSNGSNVLIGGTLFPPQYYDFTENKWVSSGLSGTTHGLRYIDDTTLIANVGSSLKGTTHVSYDHGKNWTQLSTEPWASILTITAKTFDFAKIGDRIICIPSMNGYNPQYTDDLGKTWIKGTGAILYPTYYGRKLNILKDGRILLNSSGELFESKDSGVNWVAMNEFLGQDFTVWKNDEILCSGGEITANGRTEISTISIPAGLVEFSSSLYTQTGIYACAYRNSTWQYDTLKNTTTSPNFGTINKIEVVDDSLYLCTSSGLFGSIDGKNFNTEKVSQVQGNIGCYRKSGKNYVIGTVSNAGN